MTEPKRLLRPRRQAGTGGSGNIPPEIVAWFAAGCPGGDCPWTALLPPTSARVPEWWAQWRAENPHVKIDSASLAWLEPPRPQMMEDATQ